MLCPLTAWQEAAKCFRLLFVCYFLFDWRKIGLRHLRGVGVCPDCFCAAVLFSSTYTVNNIRVSRLFGFAFSSQSCGTKHGWPPVPLSRAHRSKPPSEPKCKGCRDTEHTRACVCNSRIDPTNHTEARRPKTWPKPRALPTNREGCGTHKSKPLRKGRPPARVYQDLRSISGLPVTRQVEVLYDIALHRELANRHVSQIALRHSSANLSVDGPLQEGCSCKRELDGADSFTFEEFGVGSEAEGFQHAGLHSL